MDWRGRVWCRLVRPNERAACFLFAKVDSSDSNQEQAWGSRDLRKFFFREPLELLIGHRPNMFDLPGRRGDFFRRNPPASKEKPHVENITKQVCRPPASDTAERKNTFSTQQFLSNVHIQRNITIETRMSIETHGNFLR